jgi:hypothetical protein
VAVVGLAWTGVAPRGAGDRDAEAVVGEGVERHRDQHGLDPLLDADPDGVDPHVDQGVGEPGVLGRDGEDLVEFGLGEVGPDLDVRRLVGVGAELPQRVDGGHAVVRHQVGDLGAADEPGHDLVVEGRDHRGPLQELELLRHVAHVLERVQPAVDPLDGQLFESGGHVRSFLRWARPGLFARRVMWDDQ